MFQDFKSDSFMFWIAVGVIAFVIAQSLFFLLRAVKRGKEIGLSRDTIKNTVSSSALFSIAPAISIAVTVLVLSVALGYVLPWIRLSVIGAIQYEVPAAEAAIDAAQRVYTRHHDHILDVIAVVDHQLRSVLRPDVDAVGTLTRPP